MNQTTTLLIILLLLLSACSASASIEGNVVEKTAQETIEEEPDLICPRGVEHDSYPGRCYLYTDNNKDGFCDYH